MQWGKGSLGSQELGKGSAGPRARRRQEGAGWLMARSRGGHRTARLRGRGQGHPVRRSWEGRRVAPLVLEKEDAVGVLRRAGCRAPEADEGAGGGPRKRPEGAQQAARGLGALGGEEGNGQKDHPAPHSCTAELQPGLAVAGGRDPRDTETRGRSLPHSPAPPAAPRYSLRPRPRQRLHRGGRLDGAPLLPFPPWVPDPSASTLVRRESSPGIGGFCSTRDTGQSVSLTDSELAEGIVTTVGQRAGGFRWRVREHAVAVKEGRPGPGGPRGPGTPGVPLAGRRAGLQASGVSAQLAGGSPQGCSPPPEAEMGPSKPQFSPQKSGCGTRWSQSFLLALLGLCTIFRNHVGQGASSGADGKGIWTSGCGPWCTSP